LILALADYPTTFVDRPVLIDCGMTVLDLVEVFPTFVVPVHDRLDRVSLDTTSLGRNHDLAATFQHRWGPIEVTLHSANSVANLQLATNVGDGAVRVSISDFGSREFGAVHSYEPFVEYSRKLIAEPGRLAFVGNVALDLFEVTDNRGGGHDAREQVLSVFVGAGAHVQLTPRWALDIGGHVTPPLAHSSGIHPFTDIGAGVEAIVNFRHWDVFAELDVVDLAGFPRPVFAIGAEYRWGVK
jgi:hypothetical protein